MRARGSAGVKTFTADDVVDQFGVAKGSYDTVPLPKIKAYTVLQGTAWYCVCGGVLVGVEW